MYLERIHKIDLSDYEYDPDYQTMVQQFEIFPYELRFLRAYFTSSWYVPTVMCLW